MDERLGQHRAMGTQDRDSYREERRKKQKLYSNVRRGEVEFETPDRKRR